MHTSTPRICLLSLLSLALLFAIYTGCGERGDLDEGIPKDAATMKPPPFPGIDEMKVKMEKLKKK